ncbi:hypothetical protein T552_02530 [Pneumocystis carinii B80]|uniref:MSP domain-containing protein n=1 Tax=Pneumocystis carinii (strain B80) TaxID=1408658 RepID=A0A0W4ZF94_PNEC8|nr:hypothetical protein T552_02530 [Pneumocystis carinii B80]KTW27038.1 hypothetical protein T552_02530 [Pneumocystis carinii B80]
MSVECTSQLGFHRPLTMMVKESLFICNPHEFPIIFKIKTTAPKQYCVRPNSGRIEAGKEIEVLVLLQALKEEPPLDYKCKDKFLIQSIILNDKNVTDSQNMLSLFDTVAKEDIYEKKIKCVFLGPMQDSTHSILEKSSNGYDKFASTRSSQTHDYNTDSTTKAVHDSSYLSQEDSTLTSKALENAESSTNLAIQLVEAKTTIKKLKDQLKESELRHRNYEAFEKKEKIIPEKIPITTSL